MRFVPSLSVLPDADLMEQVVDPRNLDRAWRQVRGKRGTVSVKSVTDVACKGRPALKPLSTSVSDYSHPHVNS